MATLIKCVFMLLLALAGGNYAKKFRSDYEWSHLAGGWLKYHAEPTAWEDARLACYAEGAVLASPLSYKLKSAIKTFVLKKNQRDFNDEQEVTIFIGVHATFSKGDYSSVEGVPLLRLAVTWAPEEPDNYENSERCLAMTMDDHNDGVMADTRCDRNLPYVCYKQYIDTAKKYRFDYEWSDQAGGWLKYHVVPSTWDDAKPRCEAEGAILASPITKQLENAVVEYVQNQENFNEQEVTIFTGVQKTSGGGYSSIEGVPLSAITWAAGEPDSHGGSENCFAMNIGYNGSLAHTRCDRVLPYVCYKKDAEFTINACGTADPDYVLESRTGSCYKFHIKGVPWSEAYRTCVAEGGYLAIINNEEEVQVFRDVYLRHASSGLTGYDLAHTNIGFHDWGHYGKSFMSIHGEALDGVYHTWSAGEPNNATRAGVGAGEFCVAIFNTAGTLNDNFCDAPTVFLCEKDPKSLI